MHDRVLLIVALGVALCGLCVLYFASEVEEDRYVLAGTVVSVRGSQAIVLANVSVVMRGAKVGENVAVPVFWDGDAFVAVR